MRGKLELTTDPPRPNGGYGSDFIAKDGRNGLSVIQNDQARCAMIMMNVWFGFR